MPYLSLLAYLVACSLAVASNRRLLSPVKLFLVLLMFFSFDLLLNDYPFYIHLFFIGYLVVAVACLPAELSQLRSGAKRAGATVGKGMSLLDPDTAFRAVWLLWLFTLVPIGAQLYLIYTAGGLSNHLVNVADRIRLYKGLGAVLLLRDSIRVLNLAYWTVYVAAGKGRVSRLFFGVHFVLMVLIAIVSASRGMVLWPLVFMLVSYDLLRRAMPLKALAVVLAIILPSISVLSVLRESITGAGGAVTVQVRKGRALWWDPVFSNLALLPLTLVMPDNKVDLKYGLTFASAITDFVPRRLWPGKPDSGGIVITQEYLNEWSGTSYMATGIIAESVINFGRVLGVLFGYLFLFALLRAVCREYCRLRILPLPRDITISYLGRIAFYPMAAMSVASLPITEFTNCMFTLSISAMILFAFIRCVAFSRSRLRPLRVQRSPRLTLAVRPQLERQRD